MKQGIVRKAVWAGVFGAAGVLHFAKPETFDALVPEELPGGQRFWTYASGVGELALAGAIAGSMVRPEWSRGAGLSSTAFLAGVWPGNIKMAWDWRNRAPRPKAIAFARVPMQLPMMWSTWKIAAER